MENKMESLGGTKMNPLCLSENKQENASVSFKELEKKLARGLPESYKLFYGIYGPLSFNERIKCRDIDGGTWFHVDYFYSSERDSRCSVYIPMTDHPEFSDHNLFPFCDGESGDLICMSLDSKHYGSIYYWYHEKNEGENLLLIAEDFEHFIMKLEIDPEDVIPIRKS